MRTFLTLWRRELAAYFLSPIAYVVMIFFLVVMGFSFWLLVNALVQGEASGATIMNDLFASIFFWLPMLTVVPVLTMRLFAEEKRSGTIEPLMTAPVTDPAVVLAKYAGALTFFVILWIPTLFYALVLRGFSPLSAPMDLGPMLGGYAGAFLVGAMYLSVGLFCSSLTSNQIVAAITCFAMICVAFLSGFITFIARSDSVRDATAYISSVAHMRDFSRGAVDTRAVVFYVTVALFMLFATVKVVESRKWK
ncbi:MAG: ABC transporter permease [Verrucomicrobiota bacterium]